LLMWIWCNLSKGVCNIQWQKSRRERGMCLLLWRVRRGTR
jgi:hypothetical protein